MWTSVSPWRKAAEVTARHNFTHQIMVRRRPEHRVVQHGAGTYTRPLFSST